MTDKSCTGFRIEPKLNLNMHVLIFFFWFMFRFSSETCTILINKRELKVYMSNAPTKSFE